MENLLYFLAGTWIICSTNFPMWTKGNKTKPSFNYTIVEKGGRKLLYDEVKYFKNGKEKVIKGFDYPDEKNATTFAWRGKGILSLVKSNWSVPLKDPLGNWAVIYFSKTAFTPEGVDIISRSKLDEAELQVIKSLLEKDEKLKKHVQSMKDL
jgi:hypothetical protein